MLIETRFAHNGAVCLTQINATLICYAPDVNAPNALALITATLVGHWGHWHNMLVIRTEMGCDGLLAPYLGNVTPQEKNDLWDAFYSVYEYNTRLLCRNEITEKPL